MHPETDARVRAALQRQAESGETIEQKIARNAANAANRADDQLPERTLPLHELEVELVTVTLTELHDLIYNAGSTTLRDHGPSLTIDRRQRLARRIADQALTITAGEDYSHRGPDPRA